MHHNFLHVGALFISFTAGPQRARVHHYVTTWYTVCPREKKREVCCSQIEKHLIQLRAAAWRNLFNLIFVLSSGSSLILLLYHTFHKQVLHILERYCIPQWNTLQWIHHLLSFLLSTCSLCVKGSCALPRDIAAFVPSRGMKGRHKTTVKIKYGCYLQHNSQDAWLMHDVTI